MGFRATTLSACDTSFPSAWASQRFVKIWTDRELAVVGLIHRSGWIGNSAVKSESGRLLARRLKSAKQNEDSTNASPGPQLPYTVQESPVFGRYLVAAQNLTPGQVILEEEPLVVSPSEDSPPICIGCYSSMKYEDVKRCAKCGFPLCSTHCPANDSKSIHSKLECQLLSKSLVRDIPPTKLALSLQAIGPLRCLALKETSPEDWNIISSMETHSEERKKSDKLWLGNQIKVVYVIRQQWGLAELDEDLIHEMCGVFEVNSFEVRNDLRAVYRTAYLFAHNCVPNTRHSDGEDFRTTFRALTSIRKGDPIFVTYTFTLQGTQKRRQHLKETKFFDCQCERCKDPTECGTNISSLRCSQCRGTLNSIAPLDPDAPWQCSTKKCSTVPAEMVRKITERIYGELDAIDGNDIQAYEDLIKKYSNILGESHYILLSALHCLFEKYGRIEGYLITDMTDEQLDRKAEICRLLLSAFNKVEPGCSKQRGLILYELHAPLMVKLQKRYQERRVGKMEAKGTLREVIRCLEEAKKLLEMEPAGSEAAGIAHAAADALENMETWRRIVSEM